jgi:3-hydroxyacyl-[acyl-carrier-protein] dehydratase
MAHFLRSQARGILALASQGVTLKPDSVFYFVGIDKGRFRKPVLPGDQILLKASLLRPSRGIWRFQTRAEVDGSEVASAQMMIAAGSREGR